MSNKLTLTNYAIKDIDNLSQFNHLWIVDLSNNMIECVKGLSCFVALGYLNLSNNRLEWKSLESIRDLFIINLELHGNLKLDIDRYYRQQIVDIFPRLFSLDGEFINAIEREETRIFFEKTKLDKYPIRRRVKQNCFRPSTVKNLRLYGKFGAAAFDFLSIFPNNIPMNEEWDRKKINYMAEFLEKDLLSDKEENKWISNYVTHLLAQLDNVQSISDLYVILVLYCANMEFGLNEELFRKALESNHMEMNFSVNEFFKLNPNLKLAVFSVFSSVLSIANAKMKIQTECVIELFHAMFKLLWVRIRLSTDMNIDDLFTKYKLNDVKFNYWLSKSLIAAETFMILSKFQSFFEDITNEVLNNIIDYSTGQENFLKKNASVFNGEKTDSVLLVNMVLTEIQNNVQVIFSSNHIRQLESNRFRGNCNQISSISAFKIINNSESLTGGHTTLKKQNDLSKETGKVIEIGDIVLLGSQMLSNVLAVPEKNTALVQIQRFRMSGWKRSKENISNQNIEKINPNSYQWNSEMGYWMPSNSFGDRIFLSKFSSDADNKEQLKFLPSNKKSAIDLSKISLCDDHFDKTYEDNDCCDKEIRSKNNRKIIRPKTENLEIIHHRSKTTSPQRKLMSPNFAQLDFNEINNCLRIESKRENNNFKIQSTFSCPSPSLCSSRRLTTNDSRFWLGNGDYLYKNVKWNSRNPQNIQKRMYTPGYIKSYEFIKNKHFY